MTIGFNPVVGSISSLYAIQLLGQASRQRPQALQYCGKRNGLGRSFLSLEMVVGMAPPQLLNSADSVGQKRFQNQL
jgi:hypothetical protein